MGFLPTEICITHAGHEGNGKDITIAEFFFLTGFWVVSASIYVLWIYSFSGLVNEVSVSHPAPAWRWTQY